MDGRYDWLGLYHDTDDPRLFVPKRNPSFGSTINLGHPCGLATLTLILLAVVIPFVGLVENFIGVSSRPEGSRALTESTRRTRAFSVQPRHRARCSQR